MLKKYWKKLVSFIVFIGLLGAFLGNLNNYPVFLKNFLPSNDPESAIHGAWSSEYDYPVTSGVVEITGTTEYFRDNTYNFVGKISIKVDNNGKFVHALYDTISTGSWHADSEILTVRYEEFKSFLKSVHYNGKQLDLSQSQTVGRSAIPRIEDLLPSGFTEEYRILDVGEKTISLETDAADGSKVKINMIRKMTGALGKI